MIQDCRQLGDGWLLLAGTLVNLLKWSENFANAAWINTGGTTTRTAGRTDPLGGTGAYQLVTAAAANCGVRQPLTTAIVSGDKFTGSVWLRADTEQTVSIEVARDTSGVYNGNAANFALSTTWTRYSVTWTSPGIYVDVRMVIRTPDAVARTFDAWGAQLERAEAASAYQHADGGQNLGWNPW